MPNPKYYRIISDVMDIGTYRDRYGYGAIQEDEEMVREAIVGLFKLVSGMAIEHGVVLPNMNDSDECNQKKWPEGTGESKQDN